MNFSGILIGVLTFFSDWIVPSYCYICEYYFGSRCWPVFFAGGHFVYDSIRKNAGNTFVGFPGCFGRQLLLEH